MKLQFIKQNPSMSCDRSVSVGEVYYFPGPRSSATSALVLGRLRSCSFPVLCCRRGSLLLPCTVISAKSPASLTYAVGEVSGFPVLCCWRSQLLPVKFLNLQS